MTYPITARTAPTRHRDRATYDRAVAHALLDEAYTCDLAFVVDGEPRILPTLFVRIGETVYLHGSTGARWLLNARDGGLPVSLAVTLIDGLVMARSQMHHSANYRSLVAHGVAHLVTDEQEKRDSLDALIEKVGPGRAAQTRRPTTAELARTAVLRLELTEVSVKRRDGGVVDDEADLTLPFWAGVVPLRLVAGEAQPADGVSVPAPSYVRTRSRWLDPLELRGEHVVLSELREEDAKELLTAVGDAEVNEYSTLPAPTDLDGMTEWIATALRAHAQGNRVSWVIRDAKTGEMIGTTSYHDIDEPRESIAIGNTKIARSRWRTAVNTESKLLLMTRAFETLGAGRVQWTAEIRNVRSQTAIERLGATREGVLRRHRQHFSGVWCDWVLYSMTADEWPQARNRLARRLATGHTDSHAGHH